MGEKIFFEKKPKMTKKLDFEFFFVPKKNFFFDFKFFFDFNFFLEFSIFLKN